jgi:hypothetical protein
VTAGTRHVIAGVPIRAAETECIGGCKKMLVVVALPGVVFTRDNAVCFQCAPAVRLKATA